MTAPDDRPSDLGRAAPLLLALLGVAIARLIGHFALDDVPHVMDEIAYSLQARTFASGHVSEAVHLPRAAFAMWFVDDRVRTFSVFPPGWPAVLSVGYLLGLASWVNPLLHGGAVLLVGRSARLLAGRRAGIVAAALYALSPQALLLAATFMSHSLMAFAGALVLAVGLHATAKDEPAPALAFFAIVGAALGLTAATRPLCALVLLVTVAAFAVVALVRGRARLPQAMALAAPLLLAVLLLGLYNAHLTGSMLRFPQNAFFDEHAGPVDIPLFAYHAGCNQLGFGPGHGCEATGAGPHSLTNAFSNFGDNVTAWFWLAGGGPVVFALATFVIVVGGREDRAGLRVLFAALPLTFVLYGLYWYAGTAYGARFYHVALPSLLVLAAIGVERLAQRQARILTGIVGATLLWNAFFALRAAREVAHGYWGTDARYAKLAASWKDERSLVLVAFGPGDLRSHHDVTTFMENVVWLKNIRALGALAANTPDLSGPVVFARYHPGLVRELRARFPDRRLQLYVVGTDVPDRLVPYETSGLRALEEGARAPVDNFDAYVVPQ